MKRRSFVKASLLTGSLGSLTPIAGLADKSSGDQKKSSPEFYELRTYTLKNESQLKLVEDYFRNAAIPALNRLGNRNIGVFRELKPAEAIRLYVLIPFSSPGDILKAQESLSKDAAYNQAGSSYLHATATDPAY